MSSEAARGHVFVVIKWVGSERILLCWELRLITKTIKCRVLSNFMLQIILRRVQYCINPLWRHTYDHSILIIHLGAKPSQSWWLFAVAAENWAPFDLIFEKCRQILAVRLSSESYFSFFLGDFFVIASFWHETNLFDVTQRVSSEWNSTTHWPICLEGTIAVKLTTGILQCTCQGVYYAL